LGKKASISVLDLVVLIDALQTSLKVQYISMNDNSRHTANSPLKSDIKCYKLSNRL